MELVQEMIDIQINKEIESANKENRTLDPIHIRDMNDVRIFIGDVEVGRVQPIRMEIARTDRPDRNNRVYTAEAFRAATISLDEAFFTPEIRELLDHDTPRETFSMSAVYDWEESYQQPSRAERRKKASVKDDEELHDGYRRGLRKMLGGRNKWN